MKKIMALLICIIVVISAASCGMSGSERINGSVKIVSDESHLSDFKIKGGKVLFICSVTVENTCDKDVTFALSAEADDEDVKSGLLKDKKMTDQSGDMYRLNAHEKKTFDVVFIGDNNGGTEKNNRLLPKLNLTAGSSI